MIAEEIQLHRLFHQFDLTSSSTSRDIKKDSGGDFALRLEQMSLLLNRIEQQWNLRRSQKLSAGQGPKSLTGSSLSSSESVEREFMEERAAYVEYQNRIRVYETRVLGEPGSPKRFFDVFESTQSALLHSTSPAASGHDEHQSEGLNDERVQSEYTENMLGMVGVMKSNAEHIGTIAREDVLKIQDTVGYMDTYRALFKRVNGSLSDVSKRYGSLCLWQIGIMLLVMVLFMAMFVFIKIFPKPRYSPAADVVVVESNMPVNVVSSGSAVESIAVVDLPTSDHVALKVEHDSHNEEELEDDHQEL